MAEWKKRLSAEDANALRAEVEAFIRAQPKPEPAKLAKEAGVDKGTIYFLRKGKGTSVPTATKLRSAMRRLSEGGPVPLLPAPAPGRSEGMARFVAMRRQRYEQRVRELDPLRQRVRAAMAAHDLSQVQFAAKVGCHGSAISYFLTGHDARPNMATKIERVLAQLERHQPKTRAMVPAAHGPRPRQAPPLPRQQALPFNGANGTMTTTLDLLAARIATSQRPAAPPSGEAGAILNAFFQRAGLDAIQTLLQLAQSTAKEEGE
jgi:transcriptional regulator with XRE-family HTH domain